MSTSASASKIPNIKILKKSRKSDLLEDRLLVPVEQDVILPHEEQSVQLDSERSVPAEPITELSSSSEVNGSSSNTASGSELGNSGSLLLAQNGSKEDLGQLLTPFKSSLWTDLAEILNADTSSSGSGSAGLWGNELGELGDSSKDILLAQNTSKEDTSTSSAGSGSAGVDVSTSTMAMVLGGLALLGAAAGGGGGGGSSGTSTSSSSSSSSSSTTPVSAATSSGSLADGYIANALVFRDVDNDAVWDHEVFVDNNNNGIYDTGDTFTDANGDGLFTAEAYAITNSSGAFTGLSGTGKIVATYLTDNSGNVLTTDVSTGLTFSSTYAAPDGSSIVNPLTSLIAAQLSSSTATASEIAAAQTKVLASLGVTLPTGSSLLTYDPLAVSSDSATAWATAVAVQKVAAQVANTIQVLASAATGTDTSMSNATAGMAALTALATTVSAGTTIDLSSSTSISSIGSTMTNTLVSAGTWTTANGALVSGQVTAAATSLATINTAIKNISATSGSTSSVWANVASTQKVAQSTLTTAIKTSSQGGSAVDASAFSGTALTTLVSAAASDTTAPVAPTIVLTTDSGSSSLDKITNTGLLTLSGLETNAKVQYSTNGGVSWLRTFTAVEGVNKVQARQIDAAGNFSVASSTLIFTLDRTVPTAPTVNTASADDIINSAERTAGVTITGSTESGSTVTVNGNAATVTGSTWSYTFNAAAIDALTILNTSGSTELTVVATDAAGNTTTTKAWPKIDTTAPSAPTIAYAIDDVLPLTTNIVSGGSTNDTFPVLHILISGTGAIVGDAISLFESGVSIGSLVLTSTNITNGYVDLVPTKALTDGTYQISAKLTDQAGNISTASNIFIGTVDTVAPTAPRITSVTDDVTGGVVGVLTTGGLTNDATPTIRVSLTGTGAVVSDSVQIYNGTTALGTAIALTSTNVTNGYVDITTGALSQGTYILNAKVIDIAGNTSSASSSFTTTIDTTAPNVPTITSVVDDVAGGVVGVLTTGGLTNDATPTIRVSLTSTNAVVGDGVQIYNGTTALGTATTLTSTNITNGYVDITTSAIIEGTYVLNAKVIDFAGNTSLASSSFTTTVDTTAPGAYALNVIGNSNVINNQQRNTGVVMGGGAEAGSTVMVNGNNATVTGSTWSYTLNSSAIDALGQGSIELTIIMTDVAGNASTIKMPVTVDTIIPIAPIVTLTFDSGSSATDKITNNGAVTYSGIESGDFVEWSFNGGLNWTQSTFNASLLMTGVASVNGVVTTTGLQTISPQFRQKDAAGNVSAVTVLNFSLDVTAPNASSITSVTDDVSGGVVGALTTGGLTNDGTPTIRVSLTSTNAVLGDSVQIYNGTTILGTAVTLTSTNITNGYVDITTSALSQGTYTLNAKVIDVAGNVSLASSSFTTTIDTIAPNAPIITSVTDDVSPVAGTLTSGSSTNDTTPTIRVSLTGTSAVLGDSVQIYNGTTALGTATTLTSTNITNGFVDITTSTLSQATYLLNAKITDVAGNVSSASSSFSTTVDTTAPVLSTTSYSVAENIINITSLVASDASALTYSLGGTGVDNSKFSITSSGELTFLTAKNFEAPGSTAGTNSYSITLGITDAAGNSINKAITINVTDVANEAPVITSGLMSPSVLEVVDAPNTTLTPYTLLAGQTALGTLTNGQDLDLYKVYLTAGQQYAFAMIGTGSSNVLDPYLNLLESNFNAVRSINDGLSSGNTFFTYTPTSSGYYYLQAQGGGTLTGTYGLTFTPGSKVSLDANMGAGLIDSDYAWANAGTTVTFGFRETSPTYTDNLLGVFQQVTSQQQVAIRQALQFWSDVAGISFSEVGAGGYTNNASILFGRHNSASSFAYFPSDRNSFSSNGDVWFSADVSTNNISYGDYSFEAMVHEIGHAIGLYHTGNYDGSGSSYANNALVLQDTNQYSVMSYFDPKFSGANFGGYFNRTGLPSTPMMFDILAAQNIYGVNTTSRVFDTVYGFNATAGAAYNFNSGSTVPAFCIWDAGGTDTIDCSGYSNSQVINLNAGSFSNIGGLVGNVSIALGATIENAIGGSGQDIIFGNDWNNKIIGGSGNDILFGGAGNDKAVFSGLKSQYTVTFNKGAGNFSEITVVGLDGTDRLFDFETLEWDDLGIAGSGLGATTTFSSFSSVNLLENTTSTVYTASAIDEEKANLTYSIDGIDASLFNINSSTGVVRFNNATNYESPVDDGMNNIYNLTIKASDGVNTSSQALAITITNVTEVGDAVISLGSGYGQLIAPVQVDGGKWFYYWDLSGDGTTAGVDYVNHNILDDIFKYDVNGVANTTVANADGLYGSTDTYRFGTINGVSLALPTIGGVTSAPFGANGVGFYQPGTAIGSATASNGSNGNNLTYNDHLAVWDAYNGTSTNTSTSSSFINGTPPNWINGYYYWSATSTSTGHAAFSTGSGLVQTFADSTSNYVALQVL